MPSKRIEPVKVTDYLAQRDALIAEIARLNAELRMCKLATKKAEIRVSELEVLNEDLRLKVGQTRPPVVPVRPVKPRKKLL